MNKWKLILVCFGIAAGLPGCATTNNSDATPPKAIWIAVGIGVAAAAVLIVASKDDSPADAKENCYWIVTANGSTWACD